MTTMTKMSTELKMVRKKMIMMMKTNLQQVLIRMGKGKLGSVREEATVMRRKKVESPKARERSEDNE